MGMEANRQIKFRYEDYKSLPESETRRYELLDGELVRVPSPSEFHQRISCNLEFLLWQYVKKQGLGRVYDAPLDVVLGEGSEREIVQPDIFFISKDHYSIITAAEIQGAPDLVIEILSPATAERDRTYKSTLYARYGVKEYWWVDPDTHTVAMLIPGAQGFDLFTTYRDHDVLQSPLLPGLRITLREVF